MDINPIDWNQAQNLLLKLVRVLSPLAVNQIPSSFFLNRRFFIPPSFVSAGFFQSHPVRIHVILHEVQREVDAWIGETSKEEAVLAQNPIERTEPEVGGRVEKGKVPNISEETIKSSSETPIPLGKQAKELIHQVQEAIGRLSNSNYIQDPREAPLRETLKELKPPLDRIINAIVETREDTPANAKPYLFRHALPTSVRQEIVQKWHSSSNEKPLPVSQTESKVLEKGQPDQERLLKREAPFRERESVQLRTSLGESTSLAKSLENSRPGASTKDMEKSQPSIQQEETSPAKRRRGEREPDKRGVPVAHRVDGKEVQLTPIGFHGQKHHEEGQKNVKQEPRSVTLPVAPLIFEPKRAVSPRKKKKRKGFWFKEEEETDFDKN